jgi:molecular chaperone GrpE
MHLFEASCGVQIMMKAFKQNGLEPVECEVGADFDPNVHNAVFETPAGDVSPGKIAAVIKRGYKLHNRVIRATDVGIAQAPA